MFGFAALKPILIKEGVFRDLCTPVEIDADVEVCFEVCNSCYNDCEQLLTSFSKIYD